MRTMKNVLKIEGSNLITIYCMKWLCYFHNEKFCLKAYLSEECLLRDHVGIYPLRSVLEGMRQTKWPVHCGDTWFYQVLRSENRVKDSKQNRLLGHLGNRVLWILHSPCSPKQLEIRIQIGLLATPHPRSSN